MLPVVHDLSVITMPRNGDARGRLTVAEAAHLPPFSIRRLFWIDGVPVGASRGAHGHKVCQQYLVCVSGRVRVEADDAEHEPRSFVLEPGQGLLVPAAIYATQTYETEGSILLVLCDQPYDDGDYIRSREALRAHRLAATGA